MLQQYLDAFYRPAAAAFRRRSEDHAKLGKALHAWHAKALANWHEVHFGEPRAERHGDQWHFAVPVYLGAISSEWLTVELYADPETPREPVRQSMERGDAIPGAINGYIYSARVPASRPDWHFTPRVMAHHAEALTPMESGLILWQRWAQAADGRSCLSCRYRRQMWLVTVAGTTAGGAIEQPLTNEPLARLRKLKKRTALLQELRALFR